MNDFYQLYMLPGGLIWNYTNQKTTFQNSLFFNILQKDVGFYNLGFL